MQKRRMVFSSAAAGAVATEMITARTTAAITTPE
jgi:hypothetical protein